MSKKVVKIICLDKNFHGKKLILPSIGETEIPNDGVVELDEKIANVLVEGSDFWSNEAPLDDNQQNEDDEEELEVDDSAEATADEEIKKQLETLELKELISMAEKAEYVASEYKAFKKNKKLMINYLLKKSKEENK